MSNTGYAVAFFTQRFVGTAIKGYKQPVHRTARTAKGCIMKLVYNMSALAVMAIMLLTACSSFNADSDTNKEDVVRVSQLLLLRKQAFASALLKTPMKGF